MSRCAVMEQGVKCYGANDPSTCTEYDRDDTATEVCNNQPCCGMCFTQKSLLNPVLYLPPVENLNTIFANSPV